MLSQRFQDTSTTTQPCTHMFTYRDIREWVSGTPEARNTSPHAGPGSPKSSHTPGCALTNLPQFTLANALPSACTRDIGAVQTGTGSISSLGGHPRPHLPALLPMKPLKPLSAHSEQQMPPCQPCLPPPGAAFLLGRKQQWSISLAWGREWGQQAGQDGRLAPPHTLYFLVPESLMQLQGSQDHQQEVEPHLPGTPKWESLLPHTSHPPPPAGKNNWQACAWGGHNDSLGAKPWPSHEGRESV